MSSTLRAGSEDEAFVNSGPDPHGKSLTFYESEPLVLVMGVPMPTMNMVTQDFTHSTFPLFPISMSYC